ncbi:Protein TIC 21, chloroplastic [Capsicum annuum]|uniref:Protein TIC 21, chloroplastic n=1 Tax=Capsicum annuum TaxID=4072 RepID=A0A2G2XYU0_CAPAN|nr:Protein TIC 21, chloroplastic [Capsicum annuum]
MKLLTKVAKRLLDTARYFKRLGTLGFWGQLVCTLVAAVILSFSIVITGKITSPFTFYTTAGGIAAAFVSVFWSFGYLRLSERLKKTANEPSKLVHNLSLKLHEIYEDIDEQEASCRCCGMFGGFKTFTFPKW